MLLTDANKFGAAGVMLPIAAARDHRPWGKLGGLNRMGYSTHRDRLKRRRRGRISALGHEGAVC